MTSKTRLDAYEATIDRLEPNIVPIDGSTFYASAAISLKRIADALEHKRGEPAGYLVRDKNIGINLSPITRDTERTLPKEMRDQWTLTPFWL